MSAPVPAAPQPGLPQRLVAFYQDVTAEMRKVTWPDRPQVQQLSIGVVVLSLFVGLVIFLLDTVLRLILVSGIPRLF